jgi:hypothetical protein
MTFCKQLRRVLLVGMAVGAASFLCGPSLAQGLPGRQPEPPLVLRDTPEIRALLKERLETLQKEWETHRSLERARPSPFPGAMLPEISGRLLDAELALSSKPSDRVAAYRRHLTVLQQVEAQAKKVLEDVQKGDKEKMPLGYQRALGLARRQYLGAKARRLETEMALLTAQPEKGKAQQFKALAGERCEAVHGLLQEYRREYEEGRMGATFLLQTSRSLLDAELATADGVPGRVAACERHLHLMQETEKKEVMREAAGRGSPYGAREARAARLEAEFLLLQAKGKAARDDFPAAQALLRQRRDVLRDLLEEYMKAVQAGRRAPYDELMVDDSRRLLLAELALGGKRSDRVAGCRRYLDLVKSAERVTEEMIRAGSKSAVDGLRVRATRLEAEIQLLRVQSADR